MSSTVSTAPAWTFKGNPTAGVALPTDFGIDGLAAKAQLVAADELIVADSAAAFGFKKVVMSNVGIVSSAWALRGNPTAAPANPIDFTIDGLANKAVPVAADEVMIADSAAAFGYKKTPLSAVQRCIHCRTRASSAAAIQPMRQRLETSFTISSLALKAVPVSNDLVMIEDSTTVPPSLVRTTVSGLSAGGSLTGAVRYDAAQGLSAEPQQRQGRQNIYAAPFDALAYNGLQINGGMEVSQEKGTAGTSISALWCEQQVSSAMAGKCILMLVQSVVGFAASMRSSRPPASRTCLSGLYNVTTAQASMGAGDVRLFIDQNHRRPLRRAARMGHAVMRNRSPSGF